MSDEVKDSKEFKALEAKYDAEIVKNKAIEDRISGLTSKVDEIVSDRDGLKKELKAQKADDETKNATTEQLKELLKEATIKAEKAEANVNINQVKNLIVQKALETGFVKNSAGQINRDMLFAQVDPTKFVMGEDGQLIGLDSKFNSLKESESYLFTKSKKILPSDTPNPQTFKGVDLSDEAMQKAGNVQDEMKIMRGRMDQNAEDKNNMMSGMGNATE